MIASSSIEALFPPDSEKRKLYRNLGADKNAGLNYSKTTTSTWNASSPSNIAKSPQFYRTKSFLREDDEETIPKYSLVASEKEEIHTEESKLLSTNLCSTSTPTTEKFQRVNVYVRKNSKLPYRKADFSICLFDYFDIDGPAGYIRMYFSNNRLYLEPGTRRKAKEPGHHHYCFEHPFFCSVHKMSQRERDELPQEIAERGIDVGVSVLLESLDEQILVTRRAPHMRTFPGVWVSPGGHIESKESLHDAGLRELFEETGVQLDRSNIVESSTLGLWESVFPAVLYEGSPKRHHVVVYILVKIDILAAVLQEKLELEPAEVDACVWLSKDLISIIVHGGFDKRYFSENSSVSREIPMVLLTEDGEHTVSRLNPNVLKKKMPGKDKVVERISTGTRFAMKLWLLRKNKKHDQNTVRRSYSA